MKLEIEVYNPEALRAVAAMFEELAAVRAREIDEAVKASERYLAERDALDASAMAQQPQETPKRRGRPPKATNPEPAPAPPAPPEPAPELKVEDAKKALAALVERSSLSTGMDALSRFGATRISELKPEQWAEFIEFCGSADATVPA